MFSLWYNSIYFIKIFDTQHRKYNVCVFCQNLYICVYMNSDTRLNSLKITDSTNSNLKLVKFKSSIYFQHRWAQLTQKLAPLTASPIIKKISFANANPIT